MSSFAETAFRRHYRTIHRFVLGRVRDRQRADDVVQEVFVNALLAVDTARLDEESALAWLYTVARRRLADEVRRRARERSLVDRLAPRGPEDGTGYGPQLGAALRDATAELPPEQREILVRHLLRGQTFPELARELPASEAALKMRYVRALRELRALLEQKGLHP